MKCKDDNDFVRKTLVSLISKLNEPNTDRFETDDYVYYEKIKSQIKLCKYFLEEE